jgi:hypothetical protein
MKGVTKVTSSDDTTESIIQDNEQDRNEAIEGKELAQLQTEWPTNNYAHMKNRR